MMDNIQVVDDIKKVYAEFLHNQHYPKLESLSNWGKNRYFLSKYFSVHHQQNQSEKITIVFNQHTYCLDTKTAPDFMDQDNYLAWLITIFSQKPAEDMIKN